MIAHDPTVIEQADIEGRNALMWAAGKGANDVIRVLLGIRSQNDETQVNNDSNTETIADKDMATEVEVQQKFVPLDVNKTDNKENTGDYQILYIFETMSSSELTKCIKKLMQLSMLLP